MDMYSQIDTDMPALEHAAQGVAPALTTPAYVIDLRTLDKVVRRIESVCNTVGCSFLYSLKASAIQPVVEVISKYTDGFACSSPFEARYARTIANAGQTVHLTSPGIRPQDIDQINRYCNFVTFNSVEQVRGLRRRLAPSIAAGLRINPEQSFLRDSRYDPCRTGSKLGVPLSALREASGKGRLLSGGLRGLHFHSNCDSMHLGDLRQTVDAIADSTPELLESVDWLNMGGGYLLNEINDLSTFATIVDILRRTFDLQVMVEPGAAVVRNSGVLVASVVDCTEIDGNKVAVLDTTVNHWPEVFEFQFEPDVQGHIEGSRYTYQLVGCSCLAGDVFGTYSFTDPLEIGSCIVFENAGAYSIVKAHMFNGINLPTVYIVTESGELVLTKQFTYEDFASRCGVDTRATV